MGTSIGPLSALAGLFGGLEQGIEKKREAKRTAALDAATKQERDRDYDLRKANAQTSQAEVENRLGMVPEKSPLVAGDFGGADTTVGNDFGTFGGGVLQAAVHAFKNAEQAPRVTLPNIGSTGTHRMRVEPSLSAAGIAEATRTREEAAKQAEETTRALTLERARVGDATAKDQRTNFQAYRRLKTDFPEHAMAKQPFDPEYGYEAELPAQEKKAERATTLEAAKVNRDATIAAGRQNALLAHEDRAAAIGAKGTKVALKALPAPMAAKVGQFGEMLKKADDLMPLMEDLDASIGKTGARDIAEHGLAHLPGTRGIGSALVSKSPAYAQYQAALSPFILAAAHALSGARINQDQVEQIRKSIELAPGDISNPTVRAQKKKNMVDLINSIGGSLPHDAIAEQEDQMEETSLARLGGHGYKRIGGKSGSGGAKTITQAEAAAFTPAELATLKQRGYTVVR